MRHVFWISAAALVVMAPGAAAARARDDVMSGTFRCAAIADSRLWLDCYYGAAQPARAQLGLAPAPEAQVRLALSPPRSGAPVQDTSLRDAVLGDAFRCPPGDDRQWLNCYYAAAQPMRTRLGLAPAPQARVAVLAPPARPQIPPPRPVAPVPARPFSDDHRLVPMASYVFDRHGMFTVTLPNGEVFQQRADDTTYAHWRGAPGKQLVSISTGGLGNIQLEDEHDHNVYAVQRVR